MRYEIKKIGIWPLLKVSFFVNLVLGFIMGLFYIPFLTIMMGAMANMPSAYSSGVDMSDFPIGAMMIIMPIMMSIFAAVFNTILAVIAGLIYNLISRMMGGFEINLEALGVTPVPPPPPPQRQPIPERPAAPVAPPPPQPSSAPPPPPSSSTPPPPPPTQPSAPPPSYAPPPPAEDKPKDNGPGDPAGPEEFRP